MTVKELVKRIFSEEPDKLKDLAGLLLCQQSTDHEDQPLFEKNFTKTAI
jgi:hypothetical protein